MPEEKVNILLVDDQPNNLLALEAMLSDLDAIMVRAHSGEEALRKLLEHEFAVILLDVQMPEMDGFETARLIRERDKSRSTPIIFVTALSRSETNVFKGYSLGAVDYLFKPIVPEILRSKVAVFVELYRKNAEIRSNASRIARLSRQNELILQSAADGMIGADTRGFLTFVNRSATEMLATTVEAMRGERVHEMLHRPIGKHRACEPETCQLRLSLRGQASSELQDDIFQRADGTIFPVEYTAVPMREPEGEHLGTVLTFRDVTERRAAAMAAENERLYREAQAANKAKDDFLATLSHELRTPMTAILGWLEMIRMGDLDRETYDEGMATIWSAARAQAQLIDDMLDVSRIVMGKFEVDLRPEHMGSIVAAALDAVRPPAEQKQLRIAYTGPQEPILALADERRLRQVIWNLLSNSIKFTAPGGAIQVSLKRDSGNARIDVQDTGHGIRKEFLPHVFDRLQQSDSAKMVGGLGLGLAIARHIIELHGGTISAHSDGEGHGACFSVSLPLWQEDVEGHHAVRRDAQHR